MRKIFLSLAAALSLTAPTLAQPAVDGAPAGGTPTSSKALETPKLRSHVGADITPLPTQLIDWPFKKNAPYRDARNRLITLPRWLKRPSNQELERFWPYRLGRGFVQLNCAVTTRTTVDDCTVIDERPKGIGLGSAALLASALFRLQPQLIDGVPIGGARVTIPINFDGTDFAPSAPVLMRSANTAVWSAVPTAAEMAARFPPRAVGVATSGRVILRCGFTDDGRPEGCVVTSEQPARLGFADAALAMSKRFRLLDDPDYVKKTRDMRVHVDLALTFDDPQKPTPPLEMYDPVWVQTASPAMVGRVFPDQALKAGLKTGRAIVACHVAHDGSLTDCSIAQEEPPDLGFGQAALAIAGVMKMNPWTSLGAPVDGALIRLPIRVNYTDPTEAVPAANGGSAQPSGQR